MHEEELYEYNQKRKLFFGLWLIGSVLLLCAVIATLMSFDVFKGTFIETAIIYVKNQIASNSLNGLFLSALIGGLFFLPIPLEAVFAKFVSSNPPMISIAIMLAGLIISYSFDYFIGEKFSNFSRKLISPKQFYNIKAKINRYGNYAIFLFNVLPAPSQPLTFICGVFRYNKIRLFVIALTGWIIKLTVIAFFMPYIIDFFNFIRFW